MSHRQTITAVVLAGGQGRRMAGADKGLVAFSGRPLVEHVLEALAPQVDHVMISANRNLERYRQYGCPVITDDADTRDESSQGPLAGILATLQQCHTDFVLTVPCDAPYLCADYAARMAAAASASTPAIAHDGDRLQPMFALLHRSLHAPLQAYLKSGQRRARDFWLAQGAVAVDFSDRDTLFVNLNRPEDLGFRHGAASR